MTTQPARPHAPETAPRVPRTIDGIADAFPPGDGVWGHPGTP